jgi:hypothetical protein
MAPWNTALTLLLSGKQVCQKYIRDKVRLYQAMLFNIINAANASPHFSQVCQFEYVVAPCDGFPFRPQH